MKRIIGNIFVSIVVVIIIIMSLLLLSYNKYKVTELGNKTLLILDEDMMDYKEGSLLVVEKKKSNEYKAGDYVFFYDTSSSNVKTVLAPVISLYQEFGGEKSYIIGEDLVVNDVDIIGKKDNTKEYKGLGSVLSVLESKWGNLFLVVVPAFILFIYEIYNLIVEIKLYKLRKAKQQSEA